MTIREFCEKTGWPYEELCDSDLAEVEGLFAWFGLGFEVVMPVKAFWNLIASLKPSALKRLLAGEEVE